MSENQQPGPSYAYGHDSGERFPLEPYSVNPAPIQGHHLQINSGSTVASLLRYCVVRGVSAWSRLILKLNHVKVYNGDHLLNAVQNRPLDNPLITVSNHVSTIDDPVVIHALVPFRLMSHRQQRAPAAVPPNNSGVCTSQNACAVSDHNNTLRWSWCAQEICFPNRVFSWFFRAGKIIPIRRGAGVHQEGVREAASILRRGDWLHIFPEGRCYPNVTSLARLKWGVGKLVSDLSLDNGRAPTVIPFVHRGMQNIMPLGATLPRIGKQLTVMVGEPISFDDLIQQYKTQYSNDATWDAATGPPPTSRERLYSLVTERIQLSLNALSSDLTRKDTERSR